ncbi:MAG: SGNH/GDSL hydrolase family protein, partial [Clostridia bacterium]|nr:SGNH/GDSL hydrolase family protein [Clostridia bacterium]
MKRIITALLSVLCALTAFGSCAFVFPSPIESESSHSSKKKEDMSLEEDEDDEEESSVEEELEELETYDEYDLDVYMKPIWQGSVVYNETVMFVGQNNKAPLLYKATEIVSVRSYGLETEYEEGVDYTFDKKTNSIKLTKNTSMPYFTEEEYYPSEEIPGGSFPCTLDNASYIRFSEGDFFSSRQLAVTYRHSGEEHIPAPKTQNEAFANTLQKLEQDKKVKILFYGDSITVGANSSGFVGCEPYADVWAKMVFDMLVKKTGASKAEYINTAVGGWTSQ